jgi:hypothetical protein
MRHRAASTALTIFTWIVTLGFFFISTRFMPIAAAIIPLYLLLQGFGMLDNIPALSILYVGMNLPLAVGMMRSFFSEVPLEIVEAAQIDGANFFTELVRVVMPIVAHHTAVPRQLRRRARPVSRGTLGSIDPRGLAGRPSRLAGAEASRDRPGHGRDQVAVCFTHEHPREPR